MLMPQSSLIHVGIPRLEMVNFWPLVPGLSHLGDGLAAVEAIIMAPDEAEVPMLEDIVANRSVNCICFVAADEVVGSVTIGKIVEDAATFVDGRAEIFGIRNP